MPKRSRFAKTYQPGDRVKLINERRGRTVRVVRVIRRNRPAFFGYLVTTGDGDPFEVLGSHIGEPDRPLLAEWAKWALEDLGPDFCALITDAQLKQLQAEYREVSRHGFRAPQHPGHGFVPLHRVTMTRTTERQTNRSSNGAHERRIDRHFWWLSCPCGFHKCVDSRPHAILLKTEHEA